MSHYSEANYYELLEIGPRATQAEIESAYRRQMDALTSVVPAVYGLLSEHEREEIGRRLDAAYQTLGNPVSRRRYDLDVFSHSFIPVAGQAEAESLPAGAGSPDTAPDAAPGVRAPVRPPQERVSLESFDGPGMRAVREQQNLSLKEISSRTRIAEYYLEYIEIERFGALPPGLYLRAYVRQYAEAIGVNPDRAVEQYLERYNNFMANKLASKAK